MGCSSYEVKDVSIIPSVFKSFSGSSPEIDAISLSEKQIKKLKQFISVSHSSHLTQSIKWIKEVESIKNCNSGLEKLTI